MGIDKNANSVDQLRQFVANFVDKRGELVQGGCPVLNTAVDSDDGNRVLRDHAYKALGQWMKRITRHRECRHPEGRDTEGG